MTALGWAGRGGGGEGKTPPRLWNMIITPPCWFCSLWRWYVAAGWMQARLFRRVRKSELEVNLWTDVGMVQGKKILVTGGGGYFGHKLGNELKKLGAVVVLFDISWPLDDVVYEQMECFQVETWSVNYVIHFDYFAKTTPFGSCLCATDRRKY